MTILVVFCPCALVLATPTAIMAAIGNATRHSFLVREGDALERLASVSQVTFDKTGTLTFGAPQVIGGGEPAAGHLPEDLYAAGPPGRSSGPSTPWAGPLSRAGRGDRRGPAGGSGFPDAPRPGGFCRRRRIIASSPATGNC